MPLIDEHGRVVGRVNLIDALVGLFLLVLVPFGYGAFLLFRTPVPTITSVAPAQIVEQQTPTIAIAGTDFRPFLKAHLGRFAAPAFAVQSPTKAEIKIPDALPVGTYDLILSDEAQELVRKPNAIAVVAPVQSAVTAQVQLLGEFVALSADVGKSLRVGAARQAAVTEAAAEVLAVRPAQPGFRSILVGSDQVVVPAPSQVRVPAIVRVTCVVADNRCTIGGVAVAPDATVSLGLPVDIAAGSPPAPAAAFHVIAVRSTDAPAAFAAASLRVRFVARPEVLQAFKSGDTDVPAAGAVSPGERALLTAVESERQSVTATANVLVAPGQTYQVPQQAVAFTGTLRVPVVATSAGWQYKNKPVKVGAPFTFETAAGFVQGWIAEMTLTPASATSR